MRRSCGLLFVVLLAATMVAGCSDARDPDPIIPWVTPAQGSTLGGDTITLAGQGFKDDFQVFLPEVDFGVDPALSVTAIGRDRLMVEVPPNPVEGPVDLVLRSTAS